MNILVTS